MKQITMIVVIVVATVTSALAQLKPGLNVIISHYNSTTDVVTLDTIPHGTEYDINLWGITGGIAILYGDTIGIYGNDPDAPFISDNGFEGWTLEEVYKQLLLGTSIPKRQFDTLVINVVDQEYKMQYTVVLATEGFIYTDYYGKWWHDDSFKVMLDTIASRTINDFGFESIEIFWQGSALDNNVFINYDGTGPDEFEGISQIIYNEYNK